MQTKEKLKQILQEWSDFELPEFCSRDFDMSYLSGEEILTIIGARRCGKTYLCYQIIKELRLKYPSQNILYINYEDERLSPLSSDYLTNLLDVYFELFDVDLNKKVFIFVDEIQNIPNWSKWARRISEQHKNIKLIFSGSSAKLLSTEIATELRGRSISFTLFPMSFKEFLVCNKISYTEKNILYNKEKIIIKKLFNKYIESSGFPAVMQTEKPNELLKEYFRVMFYRDIVERHKVNNIKLLEDYLNILFDQIACKFTVSKTAIKLEEIGYSFSKNTLTNFLHYAEDAFLLFPIKKYSYKIREQLRSPKKIYAIDHGLARAIRFTFIENIGRLLENIIFLELRRSGKNIFYFENNFECDFVTTKDDKIAAAIQVTKNINDISTKKREVIALQETMHFAKLKHGIIINDDHYEIIKEHNYTIHILPMWYWLLDPEYLQ